MLVVEGSDARQFFGKGRFGLCMVEFTVGGPSSAWLGYSSI